ncbi:MAG: threonine--tRNA ligase [Planctomycetaceae bacterium]|nr:threonine--tRNA ligase [Planctomycetaceae bacterium]
MDSQVSIQLPDGTTKQFPAGATCRDVAAGIGAGLLKAAVAASVNGVVVGLDYVLPLGQSVALQILTKKDPAALGVLRHSCAHVMARAIMRLRPGTKLAFGPTIEGGFYYDFELQQPISEEDFPGIEQEMRKLIALDEPFERVERSLDEAITLCAQLEQPLKVEHLQSGLAEHEHVSFYRQGEFVDLCRGPHIPSPKWIGAYKLLSIAGAYWKGDQSRQVLQRVYATAFFSQEDLDAHLQRIEEAKRRDHRVLGRQLGLFHIDDMVGQGLILWTPKGSIVRQELQDFISHHLKRQGYSQVFTPHVGKLDLYRTSGHFPYYQDSQYPPLIDRDQLKALADDGCDCAKLAGLMKSGDIDGYLLKPMNCPHHIKIYQSQPRSYRDLPLRFAEFGTVYRFEQSGELGGLTRVRGFTQDDAHLFVRPDQLSEEIRGCLELVKIVFAAMGMDDYHVRVGLRDPDSDKYVGSDENWRQAEEACRQAAATLGKPFSEEKGEAAFYGPKIDFVVRDCIGRHWQLGTVQVDYNLPERFDLTYTGSDNKPHRPIMVHRAPFGSMERFVGVLIEHFAGVFPLWLAPEQIRLLTVSEKSVEYAETVEAKFKAAGLRVHGDYRGEKLGGKIRDGQLEKVPYMVIVGPRDAEAGTVSVRDRHEGDLGAMTIDQALLRFTDEIREKRVRQVAQLAPPVENTVVGHEY